MYSMMLPYPAVARRNHRPRDKWRALSPRVSCAPGVNRQLPSSSPYLYVLRMPSINIPAVSVTLTNSNRKHHVTSISAVRMQSIPGTARARLRAGSLRPIEPLLRVRHCAFRRRLTVFGSDTPRAIPNPALRNYRRSVMGRRALQDFARPSLHTPGASWASGAPPNAGPHLRPLSEPFRGVTNDHVLLNNPKPGNGMITRSVRASRYLSSPLVSAERDG